VLALAGTFRKRGLISRVDLLKSAWFQLLFAVRGASAERVRFAAEDGMRLLEGFSVEKLQHLVGDAMEPVLRPLVYGEPPRPGPQHPGQPAVNSWCERCAAVTQSWQLMRPARVVAPHRA